MLTWVCVAQVIVVDWNKAATQFQPDNALVLKKWKGADDDTALLDLANLLQSNYTTYDKSLRLPCLSSAEHFPLQRGSILEDHFED